MSSSTGETDRLVFFAEGVSRYYEEIPVRFIWHMGMSWQVRQRSVNSMHEAISKNFPNKNILEASTKSTYYSLGKSLSAFNLTFDGVPVENIFQSSKVFNDGGPYLELLDMDPAGAKRDPKIKIDKNHPDRRLVGFRYDDKDFPTEPKSMFYDYIYIKALCQHPELAQKVLAYDAFTDIEFNQKKPYSNDKGPFNCQARALAIYVGLVRRNRLQDYLDDPSNLTAEIYPSVKEQTNFFD